MGAFGELGQGCGPREAVRLGGVLLGQQHVHREHILAERRRELGEVDPAHGRGREDVAARRVRREERARHGHRAARRRRRPHRRRVHLERHPATIDDHERPAVARPERGEDVVAVPAVERPPVQDHLVGRVVGTGDGDLAEAERCRRVLGEQLAQRPRGLREPHPDPGVDVPPPVQAVQLPEAELHADPGHDECQDHGDQDARSQPRPAGGQGPFASWIVFPPSTTMAWPVR